MLILHRVFSDDENLPTETVIETTEQLADIIERIDVGDDSKNRECVVVIGEDLDAGEDYYLADSHLIDEL